MSMKLKAGLAAGLIVAAASVPTQAQDWMITSKVTFVEATYVPATILFKLDTDAGTCPAGSLIFWNAGGASEAIRIANAQAVFSLLVTAKSTGQTVGVYGVNSGCVASVVTLR